MNAYSSGLPISGRIVIAAIALVATMSLSACAWTDSSPEQARTPSPISSQVAATKLVDPLSEITDPKSPEFIQEGINPVIHTEGTGPSSHTIAPLDVSVEQVRFFVSCDPKATFTVAVTTDRPRMYSGECADRFQNSGSFPIPAGKTTFTVEIDVLQDVQYWLVGIPVERVAS